MLYGFVPREAGHFTLKNAKKGSHFNLLEKNAAFPKNKFCTQTWKRTPQNMGKMGTMPKKLSSEKLLPKNWGSQVQRAPENVRIWEVY